jgi:hypothetical protein
MPEYDAMPGGKSSHGDTEERIREFTRIDANGMSEDVP